MVCLIITNQSLFKHVLYIAQYIGLFWLKTANFGGKIRQKLMEFNFTPLNAEAPTLPSTRFHFLFEKPYFSQDVFSALENNPTLTNKTLGKRVLNADKPNTVGQTADRP